MINTTRTSPWRKSVIFEINFQLDPTLIATGMEIYPDDGNVFLEPVTVPDPTDNKVVWRSSEKFQIKFVQIEDQFKPLVPGKIIPLGKDNGNWNDAVLVGSVWEYGFTLAASRGKVPKETVAAKYFVKFVGPPEVIFDPVLIISR